ncbi:MAG: hypothetical protein ABI809_13765, partial [Caldimonas sp.]
MKPVVAFSIVMALFAAAGFASPARAQAASTPKSGRERIADERAAAQARFSARQRACLERFVVTSCVEDAQRERRETLSRLRHEQNLLDEIERKTRAAERRESI